MGCVYLGHDDQTGQKVAIKMMSNKVTCLPEYRQLFQAEVQSLQLMNHPSVVHIMGHSWSDNDGNFFLPWNMWKASPLSSTSNATARSR